MFTIRRPIGQGHALRAQGAVVSRHRTLKGATEALRRQREGARAQGGFSQDYIWHEGLNIEVLEVHNALEAIDHA